MFLLVIGTLDQPYIVRSFPPIFSYSDFRHSPAYEPLTLKAICIVLSGQPCSQELRKARFCVPPRSWNRKIVHHTVLQRDCEDSLELCKMGNFALTYSNNNGDKKSLLPRKFTQTRTCRRTTSKIHRALTLALLRSVRHSLSRPTRHFDKACR